MVQRCFDRARKKGKNTGSQVESMDLVATEIWMVSGPDQHLGESGLDRTRRRQIMPV